MTAPKKNNKVLPSEARNARTDANRRLRQADRLARVMRILQLLLTRGRWNAHDIAAKEECSERTIYRVMQVLELAGIPVLFDQNDGCYRVRQDFRFPSMNITEDEALGQGTAASITAGLGLDINSGARPVTRKLAAVSNEDMTKVLGDAEDLVSVIDLKLADHSRHREMIRTIQRALVKRKLVYGSYSSPHEANEIKLHLHPYRLCLVKQAWYLIARQTSEDAPRTYRVARFKVLRMLDTNAEVPEDFDLRGYFGNAWAVYRGDRSYNVEILFTRQAAATVVETTWHPTQKVHKNKDGSVRLMFQVDGLNEIVRWILGWGDRAKVIQPQELRDIILAQLNQSIECYLA